MAPAPEHPQLAPGERVAPPSGFRASLRHVLFRVDFAAMDPLLAARNTVGVVAPLAAGVLLHSLAGGITAAVGALNVCFSDSEEPYPVRGRRMLAASAMVAIAVFAAGIVGRNPALATVAVTAWAFAAGMLVALSNAAADLGAVSLVTLIVFIAVPVGAGDAAAAGSLALGGGILQTLLSLALWPVRRYVPERQALGNLYVELARAAAAPVAATEPPPVTEHMAKAYAALSPLARTRSVDSERLRVLLSQAERIRIGLLVLSRLRVRLERENGEALEPAITGRFLAAALALSRIGDSLLSGEPKPAVAGALEVVDQLTREMRTREQPDTSARAAMIHDARAQMDALAGQLRAAADLALHATPEGLAAFARHEAERRPGLRLAGTLAILRSNLSFDSAAFRHATRLAASLAVGTPLGHILHIPRAYWLPMTIAIVLRPDFVTTLSRGVLRLAGTFVGLVVATGLFHLIDRRTGQEVGLLAALMFLLRLLGPTNYGIFAIIVTALVVTLVALTGVDPNEVILARGAHTLLGGAIAMVAYRLWPTSQRIQAAEALAAMLDAYRDYFRAVRTAFEREDAGASTAIERTRAAGRVARTNLEAAVERLCTEPGSSEETIRSFSGMLASSHRLAHAMMALEAGLAASRPAPARPTFRRFADDVELTLYHAAAALRGSRMRRDELPDLREDHNALVETGAARERYALVNTETDRITNSLNTLVEQILALPIMSGRGNA